MDMKNFLQLKRISRLEKNQVLEKETIFLNERYIRNIVINDEMINIVYSMSNSEQSTTVYKISVDNGNYLELRENIKGVSLIRCYVTQKEYEDIFYCLFVHLKKAYNAQRHQKNKNICRNRRRNRSYE